MPTLKVYRHGLTAGIPPAFSPHSRSKRSECRGWSDSSTRSNNAFLRSVRESDLTGNGLSLTLTLRDCPPTHAEWAALRRAFIKRCERRGLVRGHWVTEWQRRGVPHLHGALWFQDSPPDVMSLWCDIASEYQAGRSSQHMAGIYDAVGWFQYLGKHLSRGLQHYQRCPENIPAGWMRTGRMWGHLGEWPLTPPVTLQVCKKGFYLMRRIMQSRSIAEARAAGKWKSVAYLRRRYKFLSQQRSEVTGFSEWGELGELSIPVGEYLASRGLQFSEKEHDQKD
jgi:hypothetical protein